MERAMRLIVDSGPLLALLDRRESTHPEMVCIFEGVESALVTCEAVISELSFLLLRSGGSSHLPASMVERGLLQIEPILPDDAQRARELMEQYADVPMSYADACLVCLSERFPTAQILTLDSDFFIYRRFRNERLPLLRNRLYVQEAPSPAFSASPQSESV